MIVLKLFAIGAVLAIIPTFLALIFIGWLIHTWWIGR